MTKQTRASLYQFESMQVGHSITVGGDANKIKSFRASAHAHAARHGKVFSVTKVAPGVVRCTRLPDEMVRGQVKYSKYEFHTIAVGQSIKLPMSHAARNAAYIYAKRKGIVIVTKKQQDGSLIVERTH